MSVSKISATLIVRDEAATLERLLKQLRPHVDELICLDTGSQDETPAIARKYADRFQVCLDFNNPETGLIEDFAGARNRALSLASHEWIFWADGDDEIQNAHLLPRLVENPQADNVRIFLPYEYAHDTAGRCICLQWRERLMRPAQWFEWVSPLHEVCLPRPEAPGTHDETKTDLVRLIHRRGESKKPPEPLRNLRILKAYVKRVGEGDIRALYYLGVEYAHTGDMGNAIRYLKRYEQLSGWDDERLMALLEIARMYRTIGDYDTAIQWGLQAMITRAWPEPYWELAKSFYALAQQGVRRDYNLARCATFIQLGLNMQNDTLLFINPMERYAIHELLNVCLLAGGNIRGALESCEEGLRGMPESQPLKENRDRYVRELRRRSVMGGIKDMLAAGDITPKQEVVLRLTLDGGLEVESVSSGDEVPQLPAPVVEGRRAADGKLDIVFFVGHGLEPWNGATIQKTGMGGSETMAWELSRRLARMGHRVRLYGHCTPTMEGLFDGVEFYDQGRYRNLECDVLIASRRPDAVDDSYSVKATARILWVHDVHVGEGLNFTRAYRFDAILALSDWHKRTLMNVYPSVPESKIVVTRNGIDLARFCAHEPWPSDAEDCPSCGLNQDYHEPIKRDPHKCVFSSSPDRGLQPLLDMWPRIREQVPTATLHIFYGWDNWEKVAKINGDRAQLAQIANLKHLAGTLPGVTLRGRVSQEELAQEFLSAGVWTYPTWFWETSCITAMEAQAAGLHIVTSHLAALVETVGDRGVLLRADNPDEVNSAKYQDAFVHHVVDYMKLPNDTHRNTLSRYAKDRFSLDTLADEWSQMLTEMVTRLRDDVIGKFQEVAQ
jgi:glycosyltransferase involved in cell wall biosynthesis